MRVLLSFICIALCFLGGVASATPVSTSTVGGSILVLPFSVPPGTAESWIGKGMQQDLLTDLERGAVCRITAPATASAAVDFATALADAQQCGASFVVFGQVQHNGTEIRLTGQIFDVAGAKPLGSMKATGPLADLFHLENAITGQTLAALPRSMLRPEAAAAMSPQTSQAIAPQVASESTANIASTTDAAPAPVPAYDNSDYSMIPNVDAVVAGTMPIYTYNSAYGCAVPAYSYSYPSCNLYPSYGVVGTGYIGAGYGNGSYFDRDREAGAFNREHGNVGTVQRGRIGVGTSRGSLGLNFRGLQSGVSRAGVIRSANAVGASRSISGTFRSATANRGVSGGSHIGGGHVGGGGFHGGGGGFHGGGGGGHR